MGQFILRFVGGLCAVAGFLAWIGLAWRAIADLEGVTPESDEGGRLMVWGLTGTVLMILGMVLLHVAAAGAETEQEGPPDPP